MSKYGIVLFVTSILVSSVNAALTSSEQSELDARLRSFYSHPTDPREMNRPIPKFHLDGTVAHPNPQLRSLSSSTRSPLLAQAGEKRTEAFRRWDCQHFRNRHFPSLHCGALHQRASIERNDRVEDLVQSWLDSPTDHLDEIPTSGAAGQDEWSDDYWRTQYGQTSYRYGEGKYFATYAQAMGAYQEPQAYTTLLASFSPDKIGDQTLLWSPAEKYDLTVGDTAFSLTAEEKGVGASELGPTGDVESWMGICHGWAPAAIMAPRTTKTVKVVGAGGATITWYPHDIRALETLTWANAGFDEGFIGGRCDAKKPETFPNGRLKAQECFDTNPATFHLSLGNMIGRAKSGFVMDAAFDYEVWNQPIKSYEFTYFNPLNPGQRSQKWSDVAVDYDATFKKSDRFQNPLTRGVRGDSGWDDSGIKKIVGVIASVVYLSENNPVAGDTPSADSPVRVNYTYDLELHDEDGTLVPKGGEWQRNTHPDFLWMPRKYSMAVPDVETGEISFDGTTAPTASVTTLATKASAEGMPLCQVLKTLLKGSAASGTEYPCF